MVITYHWIIQFHPYLRRTRHLAQMRIDKRDLGTVNFPRHSRRRDLDFLAFFDPRQVALVSVEEEPHLRKVCDFEELVPFVHVLSFIHVPHDYRP